MISTGFFASFESVTTESSKKVHLLLRNLLLNLEGCKNSLTSPRKTCAIEFLKPSLVVLRSSRRLLIIFSDFGSLSNKTFAYLLSSLLPIYSLLNFVNLLKKIEVVLQILQTNLYFILFTNQVFLQVPF